MSNDGDDLSRCAKTASDQLDNLVEIRMRRGKFALKCVCALFLNLKARHRGIAGLDGIAELQSQLTILLLEFAVCYFKSLAVSLELLDAFGRRAH